VSTKRKLALLSISIVVLMLLCDQILKIWVKTNMHLYETIPVFNWFHLYFVENEGMAFGVSFGENIGKLLLTLLRLGVMGFIIYCLRKLFKKNAIDWVVVVVFSLIIAGAAGNIADSLVYGVIFNESTLNQVATLFPDSGGYAPVLFGRVVDMFYFPLFPLPDWMPGGYGGQMFFPAIFNVADICVTLGILLMLIFNKRVFAQMENKKQDPIEIAEEFKMEA
jgi:signal peptidase II